MANTMMNKKKYKQEPDDDYHDKTKKINHHHYPQEQKIGKKLSFLLLHAGNLPQKSHYISTYR